MKHTKRYRCLECGRKYYFVNNAAKHNIKKHDGKAKFSSLNFELKKVERRYGKDERAL